MEGGLTVPSLFLTYLLVSHLLRRDKAEGIKVKAKTMLKPPSFLNPLLSKKQFKENILNVTLSLSW